MRTCLAACMVASLMTACGCMSQQGVTRGQSPHDNVQVVPGQYGNLATIQNPLLDASAYSASYHSTSGFPGYSGFAGCPSGGACGPGGACGHGGACGPGCGCGHSCPQHYHSYSYCRPNDLRYPSQGAAGGSVQYPYYTHKGPSDFFRK